MRISLASMETFAVAIIISMYAFCFNSDIYYVSERHQPPMCTEKGAIASRAVPFCILRYVPPASTRAHVPALKVTRAWCSRRLHS